MGPSVKRRCAELSVTIAGITTAITSREPDLDLAVEGSTARFVDTAAEPDIRLQAAWDVPEPRSPVTKLFDSGGVWQLFRDGDQLVFHLTSPTFGALPYKTATFSPDFATGVVHLRRACFHRGPQRDAGPPPNAAPALGGPTRAGVADERRRLYPLEYPLDELLITNWLALGRGVVVHACGVVDRDGSGYLFAGHSGAGKTTMARQWCHEQGVTVLSDDRIVLRKIGNQIWMYGTPWHGDAKLASRECAPLTRGFFLRHTARHEIVPVDGAQAVAELFARSFPPFFSPGGVDFTLSLLADVTQLAPFCELGFVPEPSVLDFLRAGSKDGLSVVCV